MQQIGKDVEEQFYYPSNIPAETLLTGKKNKAL